MSLFARSLNAVPIDSPLRILAPGAVALLAGISLGVGIAHGQAVDTTTWGFSPGDRVLVIAPAGDTIYLGGSFLYVGRPSGGGVPVDARNAAPLPVYPRVVGRVEAVVGDGEGGWFIAGSFTYVGSQPRRNLAHIRGDGTVSEWAPDPNNSVWTIAPAGETLYVGGDFDSIGGEPRLRLAALSTASDSPLPWRCDADGRPSALLVNDATVFVGGWFTTIGGEPRSYVAAVDAGTGALTPWRVTLDDRVRALALRDTTVYIGGYFWTANAEPRMCLIAVGTTTAALHSWNPGLERTPITTRDGGPHISALLTSGDSMFVAGSFSKIGGQSRRGLAVLDLGTALASSWNPRATRNTSFGPDLWALLRSGDTLFVAGAFDSLGGKGGSEGSYLGALSASTAERLDWNPRPNDFVWSLARQGGVVFAGGWFTSIGEEWVERRGLAAIDMKTGRVTDWDPQPSNYVKSLLFHGGKVYVGGYFSSVGGQPRNFIAALDPVTGLATPWNPGANWAIWSLQPMGDAVLAGGLFTAIASRNQRYLAAIDTSTGQLSSWAPATGGEVYSIAVSDSAVYVGGDFLSMGGQPRASLAALNPVTALATPWNPGTDGTVQSIALLNGTIYVGGWFHQVGGVPRNYVAAVDGQGEATSWVPDVYGPFGTEVHALAASDSTVYVGGYFSGLSGEPREYFAALDAVTGACRTNYPEIDGPVWSLAVQDGSVFVGGGFGKADSWPQVCFAAIRPERMPTPPENRELPFVQCNPNPVRTVASIRYTLPGPVPVTLTVFDLQGRTVAKVLSRAWQAAGPQQVSLSTGGWRPGCYLIRFEAGRLSSIRKMVVLR